MFLHKNAWMALILIFLIAAASDATMAVEAAKVGAQRNYYQGENYSFRTMPQYPSAGQEVRVFFVAEDGFQDYDSLGEFSRPTVNGRSIEVISTKAGTSCVSAAVAGPGEINGQGNTEKNMGSGSTVSAAATEPRQSGSTLGTTGSNGRKTKYYSSYLGGLPAGNYDFSLRIIKGRKDCKGELAVESEQSLSFNFDVSGPSEASPAQPNTTGTVPSNSAAIEGREYQMTVSPPSSPSVSEYQITGSAPPDAGAAQRQGTSISTATPTATAWQTNIVPPEPPYATPAGPGNYAEATPPQEGTAQPNPGRDEQKAAIMKLMKEKREKMREQIKLAQRGADQGGSTVVITLPVEPGQSSGGGIDEPFAWQGDSATQAAQGAGETMPPRQGQVAPKDDADPQTGQALPQLPAMATCIGEECGIVKNITISQGAGIAVQADSFSISSKESNDLNELTVEAHIGDEKTVVQAVAGKETSLTSNGISATTKEEVEIKDNKLSVGGHQLGITPSKATEKAGEATAGEIVENISIKVEGRPMYVVEARKHARVFWIIPVEVRTTTKIDARTGQVMEIERPWWNALVTD